MAVTPDVEALARIGAVQTIVALDQRYHGVIREASRELANGHGALPVKVRKRRRISAEGRAKIAAAQRARWARHRREAKRA